MLLSIIILNYHNRNLIRELLRNISERKLDFDYEIIVVDNASYDGVEDLIRDKYPQVKFVQSRHNGGFAYGNNLGIKQASGEYVMICNPDLAFLSPAIETMLDYMKNNQQVGLVGPRLINADRSLQYSCTDFPDWRLPLYRRTKLGNKKHGQNWLSNYLMKDKNHFHDFYAPAIFGACLIVRKSAISKVGLLDERFFMYMEDIDWCRRFWESGFKVAYVGSAEVVHLHRRESAEEAIGKILLSKTARHHIFSFIKYLLKYRNTHRPTTS